LPDGKLTPLAARHAALETCRGLREDLSEAVASLSVPTSLVRGAKSAFVTEDAFERTRRLRPDLRAVVVEDADHYVPEEQPGAVAQIVASLGRGLAGPGPRRPGEKG
jgi:2-(acetamidomethylene)succinate hydrolase